MVAKTLLVLCAQAFLFQCVFSQCINRGPGLAYEGLAPGLVGPGLVGPSLVGPGLAGPGLVGPGGASYGAYGCGGVASSGGGFPVTSVSPFAPTGLSIISENAIEGTVTVGGALPFLSAVVLEGTIPTAGTGAISYGCGSGSVGMLSESPIAGLVGPVAGAYGSGGAYGSSGAYNPGLAYGPGLAPGIGLGVAGGCGCGL